MCQADSISLSGPFFVMFLQKDFRKNREKKRAFHFTRELRFCIIKRYMTLEA